MTFFKCGCGALYNQYSIHPEVCPKSKKAKDKVATEEELIAITYSCNLCGTRTSLPHNCPIFSEGVN